MPKNMKIGLSVLVVLGLLAGGLFLFQGDLLQGRFSLDVGQRRTVEVSDPVSAEQPFADIAAMPKCPSTAELRVDATAWNDKEIANDYQGYKKWLDEVSDDFYELRDEILVMKENGVDDCYIAVIADATDEWNSWGIDWKNKLGFMTTLKDLKYEIAESPYLRFEYARDDGTPFGTVYLRTDSYGPAVYFDDFTYQNMGGASKFYVSSFASNALQIYIGPFQSVNNKYLKYHN